MLQRAARCVIGLSLLLASGPATGAEAWAFRFAAYGSSASWHDDLTFHNTTSQDAVVTLLRRQQRRSPLERPR